MDAYDEDGFVNKCGALRRCTPEPLTPAALAGLDQFHVGGPAPVERLLEIRDHASPGLIAPRMTHVSTPGALRFVMKMMLTPAPDLDAYEAQRGMPKLRSPQLANDNPARVRDTEARQLHLQKRNPKCGKRF